MSLQSVLDFVNGAVAGFAFVMTGQPFDTIKVRIQMKEKQVPFFRAAVEIFQKEGIRAYYKGMASPLIAQIPSCAILFGAYEFFLRQMCANPTPDKLLLKEWIVAGGLSGIVYGMWVCPFEMMKCIMQMQFEYLPKQYKSPLHGFQNLYQFYGFGGLFKGLVATITRDCPQNAAFFGTYEFGKYYFTQTQQKEEINFIEAIFLGGLSGLTCCLASYPMDIIKTKLQLEIKLKPQERLYKPVLFDGGISSCSRAIWKQSGFKGFWTGFTSCVVYYVIGCTGQFTAYYYAQKLSKKILANQVMY